MWGQPGLAAWPRPLLAAQAPSLQGTECAQARWHLLQDLCLCDPKASTPGISVTVVLPGQSGPTECLPEPWGLWGVCEQSDLRKKVTWRKA